MIPQSFQNRPLTSRVAEESDAKVRLSRSGRASAIPQDDQSRLFAPQRTQRPKRRKSPPVHGHHGKIDGPFAHSGPRYGLLHIKPTTRQRRLTPTRDGPRGRRGARSLSSDIPGNRIGNPRLQGWVTKRPYPDLSGDAGG